MIAILDAIKRVIERYVVTNLLITEAASIGDTTIKVTSTRRLCVNDAIAVYNVTANLFEVVEIDSIVDAYYLTTKTALTRNYNATDSYIQKLVNYTGGDPFLVKGIYLGEPVTPVYPAIHLDAKTRNSEWLTLESTGEDFQINITVLVEASSYESQYRQMGALVKKVEDSLFRSFYPLVEPYETGALAEDALAGDQIIRLTDPGINPCLMGWIFFEDEVHTTPNWIVNYLGNSVYELNRPLEFDFLAGSRIIKPRRHIFNTLPASTQYGTINKGSMLKAAVISYRCKEEVKRSVPYIDPMIL